MTDRFMKEIEIGDLLQKKSEVMSLLFENIKQTTSTHYKVA